MEKRILGSKDMGREVKGSGGGTKRGSGQKVHMNMPGGNSLLHMLIKNAEPIYQKEKEEPEKKGRWTGERTGQKNRK